MESFITKPKILPSRPQNVATPFTKYVPLRSNYLQLSLRSGPSIGVQQYHMSINPKIDNDSSNLMFMVIKNISPKLRETYRKYFWTGESLFSITLDETAKDFTTTYKEIEYTITIQPTANYIDVSNISKSESQKFKSLLEKLVKAILRENPNMAVFHKNYFNLNGAKKIQNSRFY